MSQPSTPAFIDLDIKGLYLNPSTFGNNAPNGALHVAQNVVIDRPSVVATRRGFNNEFFQFTQANLSVTNLFQFNRYRLAYCSDKKLYVDDFTADQYSVKGNFAPLEGAYGVPQYIEYTVDGPLIVEYPDVNNIRSVEVNKNFYFITDNGTYRLDSALNVRKAGAPAGLGGTAALSASPVTNGPAFPISKMAYRVVFGYRDSNNQLVLGAPSSRIIVTNSSPTNYYDVNVTFQIPKEISESVIPDQYIFQIYRSPATQNLLNEPDDEMSLMFEGYCPIGLREYTITDSTSSFLLGAALYTNTGQQGILQSNYRPPWCVDVCTFKQYTFYAGARTQDTLNLTLVSAGALNGTGALVPGDIIKFTAGTSTFTLTATASPNDASLGLFNVSNTGVALDDIQQTALNIAYVANLYPGNTIMDVYYDSVPGDQPGQLSFSVIDFNILGQDGAIECYSSRTTCWEQAFKAGFITQPVVVRPNRIYYSKFNEPDAVPVVNYIDVGSINKPIRRVVPLRDGVMVLKDDGVFRVSNAAPPFTITPIDYNVKILAPNSAAELDNKVYFLSDQGIVALADSDAQIMSFVLDRDIIQQMGLYDEATHQSEVAYAWGVAYQSDRKYIIKMPNGVYVYNHLVQTWTKWDLPHATCAMVFKTDGKLYLGSDATAVYAVDEPHGTACIYQERKTFTAQDYADNQYTVSADISGHPVSDYQYISTSGMIWKTPVVVADTSGIDPVLGGLMLIDGYAIAEGDRVLLISSGDNNGIWVASAGAWSRAADAATYIDLLNVIVYVTNGTTYGNTAWNQANIFIGSFAGQNWIEVDTSDIYVYTDTVNVTGLNLPPNEPLVPGCKVVQYQNTNGIASGEITADVYYVSRNGNAITTEQKQLWRNSYQTIGPVPAIANPVIIYMPVPTEVQTIQIDCDNPGMNKQFTEMVYIFTEQGFNELTANISSNTSGVPIADTLISARRGGWGLDPWGVTPWGGVPTGQGKIRRIVPQPVQRAGWLYLNIKHAEAFQSFGWSGLQLYYKNTSSREK